jgi:hypothetical protein
MRRRLVARPKWSSSATARTATKPPRGFQRGANPVMVGTRQVGERVD